MSRLVRVVLAAALATGLLTAAENLDTATVWNGTQFISSFGVPNTATYGQVITITQSGESLDNFSFRMNVLTGPVTFRGEVYAWDGSKATGAALFESAAQTLPAAPGTFVTVTFTTGGIALSPGSYVLFATVSKNYEGSSAVRWGATDNGTYPGGQFVFLNNSAEPAQWTNTTWSTIAIDLAFTATLSGGLPPVPVPGTLLLVMTGLAAVVLFKMFKRGTRLPGMAA